MARNVSPNASGDLVFTERVVDADGDSLSVDSVELHRIDGVKQTGSDRSPSWLSYTTTTNTLASGATELLVNMVVDSGGVGSLVNYEFRLTVSDPSVTRRHTVDLTVRPGTSAASRVWVATGITNGDGNLLVVRADGTFVKNQTFSASDSVYPGVAATENGEGLFGVTDRLARFDSSLNVVWEDTAAVGKVMAVAQGPKGFIYYIDETRDMYRINRSGGERTFFSGSHDDNREPNSQMSVDDDGRVFYSERGRTARLLDPSGSVVFSKNADYASTMAPDRDLVLLHDNDLIYGYDKSGTQRFETSLNRCDDLSINPEKDIFASINENDIRLYDFSGQEFARRSISVSTGGRSAGDWDENDNLFVCVEGDYEATHVMRYDVDLNRQWENNIDVTGSDYMGSIAIGVPREMG